MSNSTDYDVVVVGGGPAGATAANELAIAGCSVLLVEREGRIKPCGGAIPPRLLEEFEVSPALLKTHVNSARIVSPSGRTVDMPIRNGFVGMVDREDFDEWLRQRAQASGAERLRANFERMHRQPEGVLRLDLDTGERGDSHVTTVTTRYLVGADGANSIVASQGLYDAARLSLVTLRNETRRFVPGESPMNMVAAYHEIVATPSSTSANAGQRCEVHYDGRISPDFYGWVFPHGDRISVGVGSAQRGFPLRHAVTSLRRQAGLEEAETIRREGAPIPLHPLRRWDNGRDVIVAGDAAGLVAPASGEGIYYAMASGSLVASAVTSALRTDNPEELAQARRQFMKSHGSVFRMLAMMQRYWYISDNRRERFVSICDDRDVQDLTWTAYMNKKLVRAKPFAHAKIFFKNIGHLTGLARA